MGTVEVLQRAKDYLMEKGWHKGSFLDEGLPGNAACAVGAVMMADSSSDLDAHEPFLFSAAQSLYPERTPATFKEAAMRPVAAFNDHEDTTFNDVMAVYDEAIRLAKEEASV